MKAIKNGDIVWINIKGELKEDVIKSVGRKYISLENSKMMFDAQTLKRTGSGSRCFIIPDLDEYEKEQTQYYNDLICKITKLDWKSKDKEILDKIAKIIK